jgi:hypothetical protein
MSQYFLSLPHDSEEEPTMASMDPVELEQVMAAVGAFNDALVQQGALVTAGGLMPPSTATTVDGSGEVPVRRSGPFTAAEEYLGGFWVVEAADEEAAIGWAEQAATALRTRVEVRALQVPPEA